MLIKRPEEPEGMSDEAKAFLIVLAGVAVVVGGIALAVDVADITEKCHLTGPEGCFFFRDDRWHALTAAAFGLAGLVARRWVRDTALLAERERANLRKYLKVFALVMFGTALWAGLLVLLG